MDEVGYYQQAFQTFKQLFSQVVSFAHWVVCCCCFHFIWGNLKASSSSLCISLSGWDRVGGGGCMRKCAQLREVVKWRTCSVKQFFSVLFSHHCPFKPGPGLTVSDLGQCSILFFSHAPAAVCLQDLCTWSYYSIILILTNWCVWEKHSTSSGSALTVVAQNCFGQPMWNAEYAGLKCVVIKRHLETHHRHFMFLWLLQLWKVTGANLWCSPLRGVSSTGSANSVQIWGTLKTRTKIFCDTPTLMYFMMQWW